MLIKDNSKNSSLFLRSTTLCAVQLFILLVIIRFFLFSCDMVRFSLIIVYGEIRRVPGKG